MAYKNYLSAIELNLLDDEAIEKITKAPVGFAGPIGLKDIKIIADDCIKNITNGVAGANKKDIHLKNVSSTRDFPSDIKYTSLALVKEGDSCSSCKKGRFEFKRGIELGHIFKLGTKYTKD